MSLIKLTIILFFFLNFAINAEELNFRASGGKIKKNRVKINISISMVNTDIQSYTNKNYDKKILKAKKFRGSGEDLYIKFESAKTQDYNKNGIIDTWYVDENKNGKTDMAFIDDNEDGIIEAILIDENENGIWEIQIMDDDNDGNPNRAFLDTDEDKKIDAIAYDYDQDGTWDKFEDVS